ncbi:hypothetical protein [Ktedonospora formicarum]|uniref:hypothetical protein n=1 Tax=Ktedonospora formicarum TaxID=2778364 RepID=UPI001C690F33|nr:hypothetical protein [Ktedonospora formicarum]
MQDTTIRLFPNWVTVSQLDDILDRLALGDGTEMPEDTRLLWVRPLKGEFRLREMEEENWHTPSYLLSSAL